eukprot:2389236-Rhodomonas_salina.2
MCIRDRSSPLKTAFGVFGHTCSERFVAGSECRWDQVLENGSEMAFGSFPYLSRSEQLQRRAVLARNRQNLRAHLFHACRCTVVPLPSGRLRKIRCTLGHVHAPTQRLCLLGCARAD